MAFVKLDCGILNSTIWEDREARDIFITALLMAEPHELEKPAPQIEVDSLSETGFIVPPGWYGFVHAAGTGIIRTCGMEKCHGLSALQRLGSPEAESRTPDFDGRRMVRVDGGYIILNFDKYRQKDHTSAERSRRYRERKALLDKAPSRVANVPPRVAGRSNTHSEGEVETEVQVDSEEKEESEVSPPASPGRGRKPYIAPDDGKDHRHRFITDHIGEAYRSIKESEFAFDPKFLPALKRFLAGWKGTAEEFLDRYCDVLETSENQFAGLCRKANDPTFLCRNWQPVIAEIDSILITESKNRKPRPIFTKGI